MAALIDEHGGALPLEPDSRGRPEDLYGALVRSIAGQQLSVLAARAIWRRLTERFDGRTPTPEEILADDPEELRAAAGFSEAAIAVSQAVHTIRPDMKIQPAYSTNTGVPSQTPEDVTPSYVDPPDVPAVAEGQV